MGIRSMLNGAASAPEQTTTASVDDRNVDAMLADKRYCRLLDREQDTSDDERLLAIAWLALEEHMAMVPGGEFASSSRPEMDMGASAFLPSFYLDRCAVTNADYARFVADGGYSQTDLWPREVWPKLLQFVDSTGQPGPRFWSGGKPPRKKERHPVVGICWFEANAYARWAGKRLPTGAEWEQASSWCSGKDGRGSRVKYPWGNSFDPARANTWSAGPGDTVPVDDYYDGTTPNGIFQLVGNVWEWVASAYECQMGDSGYRILMEQPMAEIRGGAYDTYFESQATCAFRTGQPFLYRGRNVGFRCCVSADALTTPPNPAAFL